MFVPIGSNSGESYQVQRSLRLRFSALASLSRTFGTATNRQKSTYSVWVKRGAIGTRLPLLSGYSSGTDRGFIEFDSSDRLNYDDFYGGSQSILKTSTARFRDPTAHYHVVVVTDVTNATPEDRVIMYVNNVRITAWDANTIPGTGASPSINGPRSHTIGALISGSAHGDGYVSELVFVDGQALTPSAFGEYSANGNWQPKKYTGTYGNNGTAPDFSDPTSTTTLMLDRSGNGNNFTPMNISLTAGATYDSMLDVPLGGGGQERGNYATLNPLIPSAANISAGNLKSGTTPVQGTFDALQFNSQWEVLAGASAVTAGVISAIGTSSTTTVTANKLFAFRLTTAGALDYKNVTDAGAWTSITTGLTGQQFPYGTSQAADWNFGQRPLTEAMTSGHKALHTGNLTNTTVVASGSFTGNLSADGPPQWCNGTPSTATINGNAVTWGTHADKLATGFKLRTASSSYNSSGTNTWTATFPSPSSQAAFKYQNAKGNP